MISIPYAWSASTEFFHCKNIIELFQMHRSSLQTAPYHFFQQLRVLTSFCLSPQVLEPLLLSTDKVFWRMESVNSGKRNQWCNTIQLNALFNTVFFWTAMFKACICILAFFGFILTGRFIVTESGKGPQAGTWTKCKVWEKYPQCYWLWQQLSFRKESKRPVLHLQSVNLHSVCVTTHYVCYRAWSRSKHPINRLIIPVDCRKGINQVNCCY